MFQGGKFEGDGGVAFSVDGTAGDAETARTTSMMAGCAAGWPFGPGWAALAPGGARLSFDATLQGALRAALTSVSRLRDAEGLPMLAEGLQAAVDAVAFFPNDVSAALERLAAQGVAMTLACVEAPVDAAWEASRPKPPRTSAASRAPAAASSPWTVFAGRAGEMSGGFHDFHGAHADEEAALDACRALATDPEAWWHVVHDGVIVHDCNDF